MARCCGAAVVVVLLQLLLIGVAVAEPEVDGHQQALSKLRGFRRSAVFGEEGVFRRPAADSEPGMYSHMLHGMGKMVKSEEAQGGSQVPVEENEERHRYGEGAKFVNEYERLDWQAVPTSVQQAVTIADGEGERGVQDVDALSSMADLRLRDYVGRQTSK